jgi:hypothetical protein
MPNSPHVFYKVQPFDPDGDGVTYQAGCVLRDVVHVSGVGAEHHGWLVSVWESKLEPDGWRAQDEE